MAVVKQFYRVTRANAVVKVVREHYLRDDICCGLCGCKFCPDGCVSIDPTDVGPPLSSIVGNSHLIMLDTGLVLQEMDVLEDDVFKNVVVCQTSVDEVKKRSSPSYKRLRLLLANRDRRFCLFYNEFNMHTYVKRQKHELPNERADRAILRAMEWYANHLTANGFPIDIVLLSNDVENVRKALEMGLLAFSLRDYVSRMENCADLLERMAVERTCIGGRPGNTKFSEYLSLSELKIGLSNGSFRQGTFMVSRENYLEANVYLTSSQTEEKIFVQGLLNCNRAINNDVVVVEVLPEDEWSCPASVLRLQEFEKDEGDEVNEEEDRRLRLDVARSKGEVVPTGRVVGILQRNWRPVCAMLQPGLVTNTRHLAVPADKRIPWIRIETRQAERLLDQRIVVVIDSWPSDSRYPLGHFVRLLGPVGDRDTENEVLLLEHEVPHHEFGENILACLPKMPWVITASDLKEREDLRHLVICSIDPPGCTDIDDALHCVSLPNGHFEVGVHIADVSHFVTPGTAMDKEAAERGTTVYLVDRRIDMLPELLSSDLCSLRASQDRFAFSVIWELDKNANTLSVRFCKSIIRSRAALTYMEAQARIDDRRATDQLSISLRNLNMLAKKLKKKRKENGALTLASLEIRFNLDSESHDPIDVMAKQMLDTNSLVEEFMLLANTTVAERLLAEFPDVALLRRHPLPPAARFEPLVKAAAKRGFDIVTDQGGKALADSLDRAVLKDQPYFNTMLRIMATRCMTTAVYFCTGTLEKSHYFHFGLAAEVYTHFTSPIRRYADLMVHRLLAAILNPDRRTASGMPDKMQIDELCQNLNHRHRMAQYAGRASILLNTHLFFKSRVEDLPGYVLFLRRNAIQVLIPKYGLEAPILVNQRDAQVIFNFDAAKETLTVGNVVLQMFDSVTVRLSIDESDAQHNRLKLQLVEPNIPGFSVSPLLDLTEDDTPSIRSPPPAMVY
ncbi:hypothetical protein M514_11567 [Trichuris suis]|uniref:Protein DIS3 homolog n=1 Tax=Trichuris suis TaxID=68888 RepID=A0A085NHV8_9BILA|nr:hypothetical protein M513_11567 [Trichuris suis]KFD69054.1 hypothetical protein M514_11567 [Trichuris suis]